MLQERALRITMADPDADDSTAATAAAAFSSGDSNVSAATLLEFAQRFAERGQHAAAAHALVGAARPLEALEMVEMHDVPLDDEFADKLASGERSTGATSGECPLSNAASCVVFFVCWRTSFRVFLWYPPQKDPTNINCAISSQCLSWGMP